MLLPDMLFSRFRNPFSTSAIASFPSDPFPPSNDPFPRSNDSFLPLPFPLLGGRPSLLRLSPRSLSDLLAVDSLELSGLASTRSAKLT